MLPSVKWGGVAEFGSHGKAASVVATWLGRYDKSRDFHIFDSFQGYPAPEAPEDETSPHFSSGLWFTGASRMQLSPEDLRRKITRLHHSDRVHIHEGWFCNTLPVVEFTNGLALLIMDCNLYSSHRDVLSFVFSQGLVCEGAMIYFADFNVNRASPNHSSRKAWREAVTRFNIEFSDEGPYNWGGRKFIVHAYEHN